MGFPRTYEGIRRLVEREVLQTRTARDIARKAGWRRGISTAASGRPPFTVVRYEFFQLATFPVGTPDAERQTQFSRALSRTYAFRNVPPSATVAAAVTAETGQSRLWLEPFSEFRVTARVITSTPDLYVIAALASPSGVWGGPIGTAGFADSALNVRTGTGNMTQLISPFAKSAWLPINAGYLALGEVRVGLFIRNTATSVRTPEIGVIEIQVR